jgi:predicted HicB family RNase H-like nuclease
VTPSQVLAESVGEETNIVENNVDLKQEINETRKEEKKVERKRVSFDLRTDLHKELKMQALLQEKNIYILIEEALEKYLKENK